MKNVQLTEGQIFGNDWLKPDQVKQLRHYHKQGASLTNKEIEKVLWTCERALSMLEHEFEADVS